MCQERPRIAQTDQIPEWCALYIDFHGEPNKTAQGGSEGWAPYIGPELNFPWELVSENERILYRYRISQKAAQRAYGKGAS